MASHHRDRPCHDSLQAEIGVARADITPTPTIYARNWGAAEHDLADSIHRPLTLTALTIAPLPESGRQRSSPLVLLSADLGWWRGLPLYQDFSQRLLDALDLEPTSLIFAMTHTHSAVPMADASSETPGREQLMAYRETVLQASIDTVRRALNGATAAVLDWNTGHCQLARVRDLPDPEATSERILCGYNPTLPADDTLLVGRVTDLDGGLRATLVNYACHPTTLAWQNRSISPDYVGAMREVVEAATRGAPALFLQGASGDLAPRYQYVGDPSVADRHGRQLGYAVLATLEDMEPAGTQLVFDRVVESGAPLAVWRHAQADMSSDVCGLIRPVAVPLKQWPSGEQLERQRAACTDRVLEERLRRQRDIRRALGDGASYDLPIWAWRLGDAVLVGSMAEAYSQLQRALRARYVDRTVACVNLINGSMGYLPPAELYDQDIYQVWQTPFDRGSLELATEAMAESIAELTATPDQPS